MVCCSRELRQEWWLLRYDVCALLCYVTAVACFIAGGVKYHYGQEHAVTNDEWEGALREAQADCGRQFCMQGGNCTLFNLNLGVHFADADFVALACNRACGNHCSELSLFFLCYRQCQETWAYVKTLSDHRAADGPRSTMTGVVLMLVATSFILVTLLALCARHGERNKLLPVAPAPSRFNTQHV